MSSAEGALQTAIYAVLTGDAALTAIIGSDGVHDRLLNRTDMPYLIVGEMAASDYGTDGDGGQEIQIVIEAWSSGAGHAEAQDMAGLVRGLLDDAALTLGDGFTLVSLLHRKTRLRRETKTRLHYAEMTFRAVVTGAQ